ncbi:hypothetical protein SKAU_G00040550 [Synaphobranchus kaupii]|uniref:Gypsy retrotransposon integrase-like protein 1 n=1 Tax=Synaphobranchus kaupii TaxID=118154 RepID=A0A9Q1G2B4_SYNKA|nr:hypothetical protein SKAU_G00040550 [Synaphobranchus kaupii]
MGKCCCKAMACGDEACWIKFYMENGEYHFATTDKKKSSVRKASKMFRIQDNRLYYKGRRDGHMRLVIMNEDEKTRIMKKCHEDSATGGHQGKNRTRDKIQQAYYWSTITKDTYKWVEECPECQGTDSIKTVAPTVHPIKVESPWTMLGMDLIGPLPVTPKGNRYALSITDFFTKWVIAVPLQSKSASEVSAAVIDKFCDFGIVHKVMTDEGREFVNEMNEAMFNTFGVRHIISSAYCPQTNGQDERMNQTLKKALAMYCDDSQNDWDIYLRAIVYAINTTKGSTEDSPYYLMFNRYPHTPEEVNASDGLDSDSVVVDVETIIETKIEEIKLLDEEMPTMENPYPNLWLGYDKPPEKKRYRTGKDEMTEQLILWRGANSGLFTGKRNAALKGFEAFIREMGYEGKVTVAFVKKKWENLKQKYKELRSTEGEEMAAATWRWYGAMDEALASTGPSIAPLAAGSSSAPGHTMVSFAPEERPAISTTSVPVAAGSSSAPGHTVVSFAPEERPAISTTSVPVAAGSSSAPGDTVVSFAPEERPSISTTFVPLAAGSSSAPGHTVVSFAPEERPVISTTSIPLAAGSSSAPGDTVVSFPPEERPAISTTSVPLAAGCSSAPGHMVVSFPLEERPAISISTAPESPPTSPAPKRIKQEPEWLLAIKDLELREDARDARVDEWKRVMIEREERRDREMREREERLIAENREREDRQAREAAAREERFLSLMDILAKK